MDDDLKPRSIKIGTARWERWQVEAKGKGASVTSLIIERMDGWAKHGETIRTMQGTIMALNAEVARLKATPVARKPTSREARVAAHEAERIANAVNPPGLGVKVRGVNGLDVPYIPGIGMVNLPVSGTEFPKREGPIMRNPGKGKV